MRWFSLLLLLLLCNPILSQSNRDSLWNVWENQNNSADSRLEAISRFIGKDFIRNQPDSAIKLADIQYDFAKKSDKDFYVGAALQYKGQGYIYLGDLETGISHYHRALKIREEISDSTGISKTLNSLGIAYKKTGDFKGAIPYFERSIKIDQLQHNKKEEASSLGNLANIYNYLGEYETAIDYANKSIKLKKEIGNEQGVANSLHALGMIYNNQGDIRRSIDYYSEALTKHEELNNMRGVWKSTNNIGLIYKDLGDYEKALEMAKQTLSITERLNDKSGVMVSLHNMAIAYEKMGQLNKAIQIQHRAIGIKKKVGNQSSLASSYHNMGEYMVLKNNLDSAFYYYNLSLAIREQIGDRKGIATTLNSLGIAYTGKSDFHTSESYCLKALNLSQEIGVAAQTGIAAKSLYEIYKHFGNDSKALQFYELHIQMRDSLDNDQIQRNLLRHEYSYKYEKETLADSLNFAKKEAVKDLEIKRQNAYLAMQGIGLLASVIGVILLILLAISIRKGKKQSENLLHNILPREVAKELKEKGKAKSKRIDHVSVLFTDFKGFTELSENLSPENLVEDLNNCFSAFDHIMSKYGIEKIKTIGDSYMAAGGLPIPNTTHPVDVVKAALEMRDYIEQEKKKKIESGKPFFEIRIGVHTGPVVAGIVGIKKFQYDIWGDTVNTASRMESSGEAGKVNISQVTYDYVKVYPEFVFTARGEIEAKGKGKIKMWFAEKST